MDAHLADGWIDLWFKIVNPFSILETTILLLSGCLTYCNSANKNVKQLYGYGFIATYLYHENM